MKRRRLSLTALAGVLGVIGLTILVSLSTDSEVVAISHPVMPGAGWPPPRAPMPVPVPGTRAADPQVLSDSGTALTSRGLADRYGFRDLDGGLPNGPLHRRPEGLT